MTLHGTPWLQGLHGHQQARGPTTEIQGLRVVGHLSGNALGEVADALFVAQRRRMVCVVIVDVIEQAIAIALVQADRRGVIWPHFKAQVSALTTHGAVLGPLKQLLSQSLAARVFADGEGVKPAQRGAAMKQDQCITRQTSIGFGHQQASVGATDHPLKVARIQSISFKALILQGQQFIHIGQLGEAINKVHVGDRKE